MHGGPSDERLEADLIASEEFYAQADGANAKWIDAVYQALLGLAGFAAGKTNKDLISDFTGSAEYYKQHAG